MATDARLEQLLALKKEDPDAYAKLSGTLKMQLGFYVQSQAANQNDNPPSPAA